MPVLLEAVSVTNQIGSGVTRDNEGISQGLKPLSRRPLLLGLKPQVYLERAKTTTIQRQKQQWLNIGLKARLMDSLTS